MPCLSIVFVYLQSPLGMAMIIVFMSFLISICLYLFRSRAWFSYLLFIVFLRGIMIIFIYVSSLASNEISFSRVVVTPLFVAYGFFVYLLKVFFTEDSFLVNLSFSGDSLFCFKVYSPFMFILTIVIIVYLLIALLVVVKNSLFTEGPLRAKR